MTDSNAEIEKKYNVENNAWKNYAEVIDFQNIYQGYFIDADGKNKRIRVITNQNKAFITEKIDVGMVDGFFERVEIESSVDYRKGLEIIVNCKQVIAKDRTVFPFDKFKIEVDVFKNLSFNLTVAEVEVKKSETKYFNTLQLPSWFGEDLSDNKEFTNFNLLGRVDMSKLDVNFQTILDNLTSRKKI